jgi:hypothetical protein
MSLLGDAIGRQDARRGVAGPPAVVDASVAAVAQPAADGRSELQRRRDDLAEQVTELHWDLGGLAYEMATRDHFRLDVLVRRAAVLQERDAELAEVERLLALAETASAGSCPGCSAPHSRGAVFCWQCGATLMERAPSTAMPALGLPGGVGERDASTVEIDALLGPRTGSLDGRGSHPHADGSPAPGDSSADGD